MNLFNVNGLFRTAFNNFSEEDMQLPSVHNIMSVTIPLMEARVNSGQSHFDTSLDCVLCGNPGHKFKDCPLMQSNDKVADAYIQLYLARRRFDNAFHKSKISISSLKYCPLS